MADWSVLCMGIKGNRCSRKPIGICLWVSFIILIEDKEERIKVWK